MQSQKFFLCGMVGKVNYNNFDQFLISLEQYSYIIGSFFENFKVEHSVNVRLK